MGAFHQNIPVDPQYTAQQQPTPEAPVSFGVNTTNQSPGGKGTAAGPLMAPSAAPMGKGQPNITYPSQSGQPQMGVPNQYANTVQPWDNDQNQAVNPAMKGKGS